MQLLSRTVICFLISAEESEAPGLPSSNSLETVARSDLADDDVSVTSMSII